MRIVTCAALFFLLFLSSCATPPYNQTVQKIVGTECESFEECREKIDVSAPDNALFAILIYPKVPINLKIGKYLKEELGDKAAIVFEKPERRMRIVQFNLPQGIPYLKIQEGVETMDMAGTRVILDTATGIRTYEIRGILITRKKERPIIVQGEGTDFIEAADKACRKAAQEIANTLKNMRPLLTR